MRLLQVAANPGSSKKYALFTGLAGVGDRSWAVFELDEEVDPADLNISPSFINWQSDGNPESRYWHERCLLWNYTETGEHSENARLELIGDRYLVFSRGGLYHSLYDLESNKALVNDSSPEGTYGNRGSRNLNTHAEHFNAWKRSHFHDRITALLEESKTGAPASAFAPSADSR